MRKGKTILIPLFSGKYTKNHEEIIYQKNIAESVNSTTLDSIIQRPYERGNQLLCRSKLP